MAFQFLFIGCQKENVKDTNVVFNVNQVDPSNGLKSTTGYWDCKDLIADYAKIEINNSIYYPKVFRLDGKLYTQSIKLSVFEGQENYTLNNFILYNDSGTENDMSDDSIVMATPIMGSDFSEYVSNPVSFTFNVGEFTKIEVPVEVLCFEDKYYEKFGFNWFSITEIIVREQCFFGDFCVKHPIDYIGSYYENQETGLQIDMPALFKIHVYKDGVEVPNSPFTNVNEESNWGVGSPVCIQYPDILNINNEEFTCELWIYVKKGDVFDYIHFYTWSFIDNEMILSGEDGIVDFVLGSCNLTVPDLQLPPYQDLPETAIVSLVEGEHYNYGYWDMNVLSVNPNGTYDFGLGNYDAWCGDLGGTIGTGQHTMYIYSSLYDYDWPAGISFTLEKLAKINWLYNEFYSPDNNYGIDMNNVTSNQGQTIQMVIWYLIHNVWQQTGGDQALAQQMINDANQHSDFVPLPGGYAAVLFIKDNNPVTTQEIFIQVDP